jgi:hypothetical protein
VWVIGGGGGGGGGGRGERRYVRMQMRRHRRDKLELEHVMSRLTIVYCNTDMHTYVRTYVRIYVRTYLNDVYEYVLLRRLLRYSNWYRNKNSRLYDALTDREQERELQETALNMSTMCCSCMSRMLFLGDADMLVRPVMVVCHHDVHTCSNRSHQDGPSRCTPISACRSKSDT